MKYFVDRRGKYNWIYTIKQKKTPSENLLKYNEILGNLIYNFGKFLCSYRYIKSHIQIANSFITVKILVNVRN